MKFPQYRKYPNGASYFRIDSPESFEEIKSVGKKRIIERFEARILPDRNFVHDLLYKCPDFSLCIEEAEYLNAREKAL